MGGFLDALAGLTSGAGAAAGPYRDRENEHKFKVWETGKAGLIDDLHQAALRNEDPAVGVAIIKLINKIHSSMPGDDPLPNLKEAERILSLHKSTDQLLTPPPTPTGPGSSVGTVPGQPVAKPEQAKQPPLAGLMGGGAPQQQPQSDPTAMPASSPVQGGPMPDVQLNPLQRMRQSQIPFVPPMLWQQAQPYLQAEQEQATHRANAEFDRQQKMDALKLLEPMLTDLPAPVRAGYQAQAYGLNPVNLPASSYTRDLVGSDVSGSSAPTGQLDTAGNPIEKDGHYRVEHDRSTGKDLWQKINHNMRLVTLRDGTQVFTDNTVAGNAGGAVSPSQVTPHSVTLSDGTVGFQTAIGAQEGTAPVATGGINTAMVPTVSNREAIRRTTDENGNPVDVVVNLSSSSGKRTTKSTQGGGVGKPIELSTLPNASSSTTPPTSGGVEKTPEGQKIIARPGLTAKQLMDLDVDNAAMDQTIKRMEGIKARLPLLANMLSAKKIELNMDAHGSFAGDALRRLLPMSSEEAKLTSDFIAMMEDINKIRGAFGATSFRGPEAFAAMIAQAGRPGANPEVTAQQVNNTLETLKSIRREKAKARAAGRTGGGGGKVRMSSPDGSETIDVDAKDVAHYESLGAKRVQ